MSQEAMSAFFTLDGLKHFFVHGFVDPVVGVHKADKFALRNIHSKVARTGQPPFSLIIGTISPG